MSGALNKIFAEVSDFTKVMGSLHSDFLNIVRRDIDRFLEKTNDLTNQMNWQGWTTFGLNAFSASFAVAGAFIPKGDNANPASQINPRLGAHEGITDGFSNTLKTISQKLSDNDFLRTTCKTAHKFFNGVSPVADIWFKSSTTKLESDRALLERVNLQDGQANKSNFGQQAERAQQAVSRLLDNKSKGGG